MFFFFKQKTAYEMRISDWSSDVCSSDLHAPAEHPPASAEPGAPPRAWALPWISCALSSPQADRNPPLRHPSTTAPRYCFRSEERRLGNEWVSTFSSRWSPHH